MKEQHYGRVAYIIFLNGNVVHEVSLRPGYELTTRCELLLNDGDKWATKAAFDKNPCKNCLKVGEKKKT